MTSSVQIVASLLCVFETYHVITHLSVVFRVRLLPRKDLARVGYYFLVDTATVFVTSFLFTGRLRWLAALQIAEHMFFFLTWNKHSYTKQVMNWSSLDWTRSPLRTGWHLDKLLGTWFDIVVHLLNVLVLAQYHMSAAQVVLSMMVANVLYGAVILSGKNAWSDPQNIPTWVLKRLGPIPESTDKIALKSE